MPPPLEQAGRGGPKRNPKVLIPQPRDNASSRRALQEPDLQEVGLVDIFNRVDFFAEDGRNRVHTDRPTVKALDDRAKQLPVDVIEALLIEIQ